MDYALKRKRADTGEYKTKRIALQFRHPSLQRNIHHNKSAQVCPRCADLQLTMTRMAPSCKYWGTPSTNLNHFLLFAELFNRGLYSKDQPLEPQCSKLAMDDPDPQWVLQQQAFWAGPGSKQMRRMSRYTDSDQDVFDLNMLFYNWYEATGPQEYGEQEKPLTPAQFSHFCDLKNFPPEISELRTVMNYAPSVTKEFIVYRGIRRSRYLRETPTPGIFMFFGYQSTAVYSFVSATFAQTELMRIRVPVGAHVAVLASSSHFPLQSEILLPHGTLLKYLGEGKELFVDPIFLENNLQTGGVKSSCDCKEMRVSDWEIVLS